MGEAAGRVPLAFTLFVFILVANWLELIPTGHSPQYLPSPRPTSTSRPHSRFSSSCSCT